MNKLKLLQILVGILLVANLFLCFMLYGQKKHHHEGPRKLIIEKLHFDKAQIALYDTLIQAHRKAIDEKQQTLMQLKNGLYAQLKTENKDTSFSAIADSLLRAINALQMDIEKVHYAHFKGIKNLCTNTQQSYFEQLTHQIAGLFAPVTLPKKH